MYVLTLNSVFRVVIRNIYDEILRDDKILGRRILFFATWLPAEIKLRKKSIPLSSDKRLLRKFKEKLEEIDLINDAYSTEKSNFSRKRSILNDAVKAIFGQVNTMNKNCFFISKSW